MRWLRHVLPFVGCPLNHGASYCPFFVVGSGRSGNTLIRRILYAHKDLHIPPETYVLGHIIKLFYENRNMGWGDLVRLILAEFEYHQEFSTFEIPSLRPLVHQLSNVSKEKRSLAYVLNTFYSYHAEVHDVDYKRWGDKSPLNAYVMDDIYKVFPDAQFIHLLRDGCDVVYSYLQSGHYQSIESAAHRWTSALQAARTFMHRHPEACIEVRYEALVSTPESTVEQICRFLGIDYHPNIIDRCDVAQAMGDVHQYAHHQNVQQPINTKSIGKGRRNLTEEQKLKLEALIGKQLRDVGYDSIISY